MKLTHTLTAFFCACLLLANWTVALAQSSPVPPAQYGPWRSCRIGGGGYAQNVVLCPSDPKRCYAYIDVGGLYRSDDGGQTWRMLHGNLPARETNYQVRGLVVDPRNADIVLIATGSQWADQPEGLYRSTDGGTNWKKTLNAYYMGNGDDRWAGLLLARDPKQPDVIVAASENTGVFRSTDNGLTWNKRGLEGLHPTDLKFDTTNPKRLWLCALPYHGWFGGKMTTLTGGFFRSDDGGTTWKKLADAGPSEVLPDPMIVSRLYGIVNNRVQLSSDAGATWTDASSGCPPPAATAATRAKAASSPWPPDRISSSRPPPKAHSTSAKALRAAGRRLSGWGWTRPIMASPGSAPEVISGRLWAASSSIRAIRPTGSSPIGSRSIRPGTQASIGGCRWTGSKPPCCIA